MKQQFDQEKEYGIVLEGGGAKGAYQIGVWKALRECNVKIKGIAGVSVGALNGALMCMGDLEKAEEIWNNIKYSSVMDVDDKDMQDLMKHDIKNINLPKITKNSAKAVTGGGIDITPLRNLVERSVDEDKIRASNVELFMGTLNFSDRKGVEIDVKELGEGELKDYLIASASLPVFKQEKLQGKTYLDGGMVNNVPIDMLIKRDYKDIIVIRIYGIGVEKKVKIPEDVNVLEIAPRVELGNILEFDAKKAQRNMKIGYFDGMRILRDLQGKIYYISEVGTDREHMLSFLNIHQSAKMAWLEYFKEDYTDESMYDRKMFEVVLPGIAEKLGLAKNWTYTELYLSMLELAAKRLKVIKYHIYTEKEFIKEVQNSYKRLQREIDTSDLFVQLMIRTMAIADDNL